MRTPRQGGIISRSLRTMPWTFVAMTTGRPSSSPAPA
jgi:hypothetical protein